MQPWVITALLSMVLTGVGNFFFKMATSAGQAPMAVVMMVFAVDMTIAALVFLFLRPPISTGFWPLVWPLMAGVTSGLGVLMLIKAIGQPEAKAGVATALMNANFILVTVLSWAFCKEALSLKQILGLLAMIGGMLLLI